MTSVWIGKEIEVTMVNPEIRSICMLIHLYCAPVELTHPHIQARVANLLRIGCKYLQDEGFVPQNPLGWVTHVGGVAHGKPL